jgi:hypothetical protein
VSLHFGCGSLEEMRLFFFSAGAHSGWLQSRGVVRGLVLLSDVAG